MEEETRLAKMTVMEDLDGSLLVRKTSSCSAAAGLLLMAPSLYGLCVWQGLLRREEDLENLAHSMVLQAATGLAALHTRGIMHRDLKVQHDLTQTALPYCLPPPPYVREESYPLLPLKNIPNIWMRSLCRVMAGRQLAVQV